MTRYHIPCEDCGSSDALTDYGDHTHCFSCGAHKNNSLDKEVNSWYSIPKESLRSPLRNSYCTPTITYNNSYTETYKGTYTLQYVNTRGISTDTMRFYGVQCKVSDDGEPLQWHFPYGPEATKFRMVEKKDFKSEGDMKKFPLFGMDKFTAGSAKAITITEGEFDAMSVFQMMDSKWPCVSVRGSGSAKGDCQDAFKYLNSFDRIYLAFDADEPGQKAVKEVARLFDPNKVYHVVMDSALKDANQYLQDKRQGEFSRIWWNAKPYLPKGIVASYTDIEEILNSSDEEGIAEFPFPTLNEMTYGLRSGKVYLFTAREKVGKTSVMKAIEYHLLKTTDYNIGLVHLEEGEKKTIRGLATYELKEPCDLPDSGISNAQVMDAYKAMTKRDGRLHFYTHFGSDDEDTIIDMIRYMVAVCKCKFVVLDHITMLVTGNQVDDERRKLDYISTRLAMLTRELDFTLLLVSHVNADGDTRGSKNISKVADLIVYIDRDIESADYDTRHTTSLLVKGNRDVAKSGPAGYLWFDEATYCLAEKTVDQHQDANAF